MLVVLTFNLVNCQLVDVSVNVTMLAAFSILILAQKRTEGQAVVPQRPDEVCQSDSEKTQAEDWGN